MRADGENGNGRMGLHRFRDCKHDLYSYVRLIRCVAEEISDEPDWMASLRERFHGKSELLESGISG